MRADKIAEVIFRSLLNRSLTMIETSNTSYELNPYAATLDPGARTEPRWPGVVDLFYAALLFAVLFAGACCLRWLFHSDGLYFFLLAPGPVAALLVEKGYRERTGLEPARVFKALVAIEITALFCAPAYLLAQSWGVTGHPLVEAVAGAVITLAISFAARETSHADEAARRPCRT